MNERMKDASDLLNAIETDPRVQVILLANRLKDCKRVTVVMRDGQEFIAEHTEQLG